MFWIAGNTWDGLFFGGMRKLWDYIYNQNFGILIFQVGILFYHNEMGIMGMQDGGLFELNFFNPKFEIMGMQDCMYIKTVFAIQRFQRQQIP